jgi:hypothetical protein
MAQHRQVQSSPLLVLSLSLRQPGSQAARELGLWRAVILSARTTSAESCKISSCDRPRAADSREPTAQRAQPPKPRSSRRRSLRRSAPSAIASSLPSYLNAATESPPPPPPPPRPDRSAPPLLPPPAPAAAAAALLEERRFSRPSVASSLSLISAATSARSEKTCSSMAARLASAESLSSSPRSYLQFSCNDGSPPTSGEYADYAHHTQSPEEKKWSKGGRGTEMCVRAT